MNSEKMTPERLVVTQGQHAGKRGRRIWYFQTGGVNSVLVIMILCDDGEVIHVNGSWTALENGVPK